MLEPCMEPQFVFRAYKGLCFVVGFRALAKDSFVEVEAMNTASTRQMSTLYIGPILGRTLTLLWGFYK